MIPGSNPARTGNYSRAPYYSAILKKGIYSSSPTVMAWGTSYGGFGLTGELLLVAMLFIYAGAHDNVKRTHYETFWATHHFFVLFFVCLYFHGSVFWQWGFATIVPYIVDRVLVRAYLRAGKPMALTRVYFWGKPNEPDVVTLQFDNRMSDKGRKPMEYMEGHYLYLNCPTLEGAGWAMTRRATCGLLQECLAPCST